MRTRLFALVATAAAAALLAGCAAVPESTQIASVECKVQPRQTATISSSKRRPISDIERAQAVADFARFDASVSRTHLALGHNQLYEDILRDCR